MAKRARAGVKKKRAAAPEALARARSFETLESAYAAWLELKLEHAAASRQLADERRRLEDQGAFLVGAVKAAGDAPEAPARGALAKRGGLDRFQREAEAKLVEARHALEQRQQELERTYSRALDEARALVRERVERFAQKLKPKLTLMPRPLAGGRRILHLARPSADEAVLVFFVLTGSVPSRYGYLFDDATDDLSTQPPVLYAEEGVTQTRPSPRELKALVTQRREVMPVKGVIPALVPSPGGEADLFVLRQRGPVMEVELAAEDALRSVLSADEAERFAGHLLRLKLEGRLELALEAG